MKRAVCLMWLFAAACAHHPGEKSGAVAATTRVDRAMNDGIAKQRRGEDGAAFVAFASAVEAAAEEHDDEVVMRAAAQRILSMVPDLDARQETRVRLQALIARRLPRSVRSTLLLASMRLARLDGDEEAARRWERQRGCSARWAVVGPVAALAYLGLSEGDDAERSAKWSERDAVLSRGCGVQIDTTAGRSGVIFATSWWRVPRAESARVTIESNEPWKLFVDGIEVYSHADDKRELARAVELEVALESGWHRVSVKMSAPWGRARLADFAFEADGAEPYERSFAQVPTTAQRVGRATRLLSSATPSRRAVIEWARATDALATGALDVAKEAALRFAGLGQGPAVVASLEAELARADQTAATRVRRERERAALVRAIASAPDDVSARVALASLELDGERPREAIARLEAIAQGRSWRAEYTRFIAFKTRGWVNEAEEALGRARALAPHLCAPREAEVDWLRSRGAVIDARARARESVHCDGGNDRFAERLRDTGELEAARLEYLRLLVLDPSRESWQSALADVCDRAGRTKDAVASWQALAQRFARNTYYRRRLANSAIASGDVALARRVLKDGLFEVPESQELRQSLEALSVPGPMEPYRRSGEAVIAAYERSQQDPRARYQAPAVMVLDRTVMQVFPAGARLSLTHNIVHVLDKSALDKFGEFRIPDGAQVLTLRTRKADGTMREPEEIAGKAGTSVPDLEVGDYVEFEYVEAQSPTAAFPDGFLSDRFYFQSYDAPLDRSEFVVVTPLKMVLQIDRRGGAPKEQLQETEDLAVRTFVAERAAQVFSEPSSTPNVEYLPSVRVASGVSVDRWRDYLADQLWGSARLTREVTRLAAVETSRAVTIDAKIDALDAWVRAHIKQGGALAESASSILARGEGNRLTLLRALLWAVDIPSEVLLARSTKAARIEGAVPQLEVYDQSLLVAHHRVLDPRFRHAAAGLVSPLVREQPALRLAPGPALTRVDAERRDARAIDMSVTLDAQGRASVVVRERMRGWPALDWREALDKLSADQVRPQFEQHTLGYYFPGAVLESLTWKGKDDDADEFEVEYRFTHARFARRTDAGWVLAAPFAARLSRRYIGVASRKTALEVDYVSATELRARFTLPHGAKARVAADVLLAGPGKFRQRVSIAGNVLSLESDFSMPAARIAPGDYAAFLRFATEVDRAESKIADLEF